MYHHQAIEEQEGRVIKYYLYADKKTMSFREVIDSWQNVPDFRAYYNKLLADCLFPAYFWEVKPITQSSLDEDFEFVLVNSPALARVKADISAFQQYFNGNDTVVSFQNLRKDAMLVVPVAEVPEATYTHIANFVRNAPEHQINLLWKMTGELYEKLIQDEPRWLSTSGLGVFWLHIRIDSRPKYYTYQPYKKVL